MKYNKKLPMKPLKGLEHDHVTNVANLQPLVSNVTESLLSVTNFCGKLAQEVMAVPYRYMNKGTLWKGRTYVSIILVYDMCTKLVIVSLYLRIIDL